MSNNNPSRGLHIGLWVVQGLLAFAFLGAGAMKATTPYAELAAKMAWAQDFSEMSVKLIGISEILGALGLILPSATRILPKLTPLAAALLVLTMVGAAVVHIQRGEIPMIVPNVVLGLLSAFVAFGRLKLAPIGAR